MEKSSILKSYLLLQIMGYPTVNIFRTSQKCMSPNCPLRYNAWQNNFFLSTTLLFFKKHHQEIGLPFWSLPVYNKHCKTFFKCFI